jgi:tetrahydromethanopterin S-methyltransferase subunit F
MNAQLFRTRVAVLWVAVAVALSYSVLIYLLGPGALEEALAGEMEGDPLDDSLGFLLSVLVGIPLVMAAATLLVGDRVNRYVNLIAGLLFGLLVAYAMVGELLAGEFNGHLLLVALGCSLAFLIAVLGLVGLRQPPSEARP